ncbi:MAG TPA: flavodoxin family protein, partial [Dehalococcoidales bacterium]|nr:flavodoxin family protein [Dehalococcoidales bacterium]
MNILGIVASPRKNGNSEIMVNEALKTAREAGCETEIFLAAGKRLEPCLACGSCFRVGACVQKDDMQELYRLYEKADGIILCSPVYFHNVSAQAKIIMDRTFALLMKQNLKGKVGGAIVTVRRIGGSQTRALIYDFFIAHHMVVAGGAIGYGPHPGDVLTGVGGGINMSAMDEARMVGLNVTALVKKLKSKLPE